MEVLFIAPFINNIIPSYTCAYNRMDVIVWKRDSSVHFLEYYNNAVMDGPILSLFKCLAYIFNQICIPTNVSICRYCKIDYFK